MKIKAITIEIMLVFREQYDSEFSKTILGKAQPSLVSSVIFSSSRLYISPRIGLACRRPVYYTAPHHQPCPRQQLNSIPQFIPTDLEPPQLYSASEWTSLDFTAVVWNLNQCTAVGWKWSCKSQATSHLGTICGKAERVAR